MRCRSIGHCVLLTATISNCIIVDCETPCRCKCFCSGVSVNPALDIGGPMNGRVIVITGALGALGRVVAEQAHAKGARVAGLDHAQAQTPASATRLELGGVDLTDPAQATKAIDT